MKKNLISCLNGLFAGILIAIAGIANFGMIKLFANSSMPGLGKALGSVVFAFGLIFVCFLGTNLYTGKIGFVFEGNKKEKVIECIIALVFNIIGALIVSLFFVLFDGTDGELVTLVNNCVTGKLNIYDSGSGWYKTLFSSIFCGIMIYLAVFFFKKYDNPFLRIVGIIFPIIIFVSCGFDHCIANVFYFGTSLFTNKFTPEILMLLLINIVGNSIGSLLIYAITKPISALSISKTEEKQ
ncbi:MAG: formate/nitrite transporter family protein [Bacilli bacterium]